MKGMHIRNLRSSVTAALVAALLGLSIPAQPAKADTTSTLLIGAAAAAAAFTAINVTNKNRKANSLAGYLGNGDAVYADGHVTTRSGNKYYPGDHGQTIQCANQHCRIVGQNGMYNGHKYGYTHHS
jgi:hypothetical protein